MKLETAAAAQAWLTRCPTSLLRWAMVFDLRYFDGCQSVGKPPQCTGTCIQGHFVPEPMEWIEVYEPSLPGGGTQFVAKGCATHHGLDGYGGIIEPSFVGTKAAKLCVRITAEPKGMLPAYAPGALTDQDLAASAAYLNTMGKTSTAGEPTPMAASPPMVAPSAVPTSTTLTTTNSELTGASLFQMPCAVGHGQDAAGKTFEDDGNTISTPSLSWSDLSQAYATDPSRGTVEQQLVLAITKGLDKSGDDLNPMMPHQSFLSQQQVNSLIQYIQATFK